MLTVLAHTPPWVWLILAALLVAGFAQTRDRRLSRPVVLILPAAMVALSLYGISASFGVTLDALGAWLAGVAAAALANERLFRGPRAVDFRPRAHATSCRAASFHCS